MLNTHVFRPNHKRETKPGKKIESSKYGLIKFLSWRRTRFMDGWGLQVIGEKGRGWGGGRRVEGGVAESSLKD